ncbi:MAG: FadR/GntR family transcriptional regulator [Beijerinckiaceae bacterium]
MKMEPIRPRRLYRQVADQLRQLIEGGAFAAAGRLPTERELAQRLEISRPTVREALIALEVDGLIDIRVGSGIYVLPISSKRPGRPAEGAPTPIGGPFEILNARALFEGAVAEAAARIATPADIRAIDAAIGEMRSVAHPGPRTMALDRAFHVAVADILQNDAVTKTIGDLFDQRVTPYFAQLASYFEDAGSWSAAVDEHQAVRDRIAANDSEGAGVAMRRHLGNSQIRFSESFGEGLPAPERKTAAASAIRTRRTAPSARRLAAAGTNHRRKTP